MSEACALNARHPAAEPSGAPRMKSARLARAAVRARSRAPGRCPCTRTMVATMTGRVVHGASLHRLRAGAVPPINDLAPHTSRARHELQRQVHRIVTIPSKQGRHSRTHRTVKAPDSPATGRPRRGSISRTSAAGTDALSPRRGSRSPEQGSPPCSGRSFRPATFGARAASNRHAPHDAGCRHVAQFSPAWSQRSRCSPCPCRPWPGTTVSSPRNAAVASTRPAPSGSRSCPRGATSPCDRDCSAPGAAGRACASPAAVPGPDATARAARGQRHPRYTCRPRTTCPGSEFSTRTSTCRWWFRRACPWRSRTRAAT